MSQKEVIKEAIIGNIPVGRNQAINMSELLKRTGLKRRDCTDFINELREEYPICATRVAPGGYWIGNVDDIDEMIIMYNHSIQTMQRTVNQLLKHRDELTKKRVVND